MSVHSYKRNGILPMLKRNSSVKLAPQRWQENAADGSFDVVFAFEEKVFDMVVEGWHISLPQPIFIFFFCCIIWINCMIMQKME